MKNVFIRLFVDTGARIGLFYVIFKISLYVLSNFYSWDRSIQRGMLWWMYLVCFSVVVFVVNVALLFWKDSKFISRLSLGFFGVLVLVLCFFKSIKYAPYSVLLPHFIASFILLLLPVFSEVLRQKGVKAKSV